jgi:hypothetical protein
MRNRGIHNQVDGTSSASSTGRRKRAAVFDVTDRTEAARSRVVLPQPILMQRSASLSSEQGLSDSEVSLDLLIDSAGKVRSAESAGGRKLSDTNLINAAMDWTFVPAFKDGHAVASRLRLAVSAKR